MIKHVKIVCINKIDPILIGWVIKIKIIEQIIIIKLINKIQKIV